MNHGAGGALTAGRRDRMTVTHRGHDRQASKMPRTRRGALLGVPARHPDRVVGHTVVGQWMVVGAESTVNTAVRPRPARPPAAAGRGRPSREQQGVNAEPARGRVQVRRRTSRRRPAGGTGRVTRRSRRILGQGPGHGSRAMAEKTHRWRCAPEGDDQGAHPHERAKASNADRVGQVLAMEVPWRPRADQGARWPARWPARRRPPRSSASSPGISSSTRRLVLDRG